MAKKKEIKLDEKLAKIAEQEPDFSIINDHPLSGDAINYEDFNLNYHLGPIYDILRSTDTKPPMAIAIYGDWGTGKTTAMRWLEAMLNHWNKCGKAGKGKGVLVKPVWFFPWKYDNKEDVWRGLIAEVILQSIMVTDADLGTVTKAAKQFGLFLGKSFLHSLSCLSINIPGLKAEGKDIASAIREVVNEFHAVNQPEKAYLNEFESTLKSWISDTVKDDKRLVVFVDDLDRCLPDVALEVLEALKLYLNIEKMIFVVGVDRVVIERLVRRHYIDQGFDEDNELDRMKFKTYLQKMFQVEVTLVPTVQQMEGFLENCLERHVPAWNKLLEKEHQDIFKKLIKFYGKRTPREVKRLINSSLREGVGAIKVTTGKTDKKQACAQGMQVHFLREELIRQYGQTEVLGDNGDGDEFFRSWSRIVVNNYKKDKSFQCYIDKIILEGFRGDVKEAKIKKEGQPGIKIPAKAETETEREKEQLQLKPKAPKEYKELLNDERFVRYLYLLDNVQIGELMKIDYPAKDSPLLVNAAAISRSIEAETSDEKIILERISRELDKSVNEIGDKDLDELTELDLSSAKISDYSFLSRLKGLQTLSLSGNKLTTLPEAIGILTALQKLYLSNNQLTTVPVAIGKLTALKGLYLYSNQLTAVPEAIGKLTTLRTLSLSDNQLTTVPEAIGKLTALQELFLLYNQFSKEEKARIKELVPQDCDVRF
jgi:hypothetical protein